MLHIHNINYFDEPVSVFQGHYHANVTLTYLTRRTQATLRIPSIRIL